MRVDMHSEEWYPVLAIVGEEDEFFSREESVEIPDELWENYQATVQSFHEIQLALRDLPGVNEPMMMRTW